MLPMLEDLSDEKRGPSDVQSSGLEDGCKREGLIVLLFEGPNTD